MPLARVSRFTLLGRMILGSERLIMNTKLSLPDLTTNRGRSFADIDTALLVFTRHCG